MIPVGISIEFSRAVAWKTETVVCERCRCIYQYRVAHESQGVGSTVRVAGLKVPVTAPASESAISGAKAVMPAAIEPVPCPDCGWYQAAMVDEIERRRRQVPWSPFEEGVSANARYPRPPKLFPAAPPPTLIKRDPSRTGALWVTRENQSPEIEPGGWISVAWAQHSPTKVCAMCLKPASITGRLLVAYSAPVERQYPVSLCVGCGRRVRARRKWIKGAIILGFTALVWLAFMVLMWVAESGKKDWEHGLPLWLLPTIGAAALGIFFGILVARSSMANRMFVPVKIMEGRHGAIRLLFENLAYRPAFAAEMGEQRMETVVQAPSAQTGSDEEDITAWAKRR